MESVGHEGDVWVHKPHNIGSIDLNRISWVEEQLEPSD